MTETILRIPDVKARTGQSRSTIYARIAEGKFPKQIPLGCARSVGWLESEVSAWIDACVAERDSSNHIIERSPADAAPCAPTPGSTDGGHPSWKKKLRARTGAKS